VAFSLRCDIDGCSAEIQSGPGQPTLQGKKALYCSRCQGYIDGVEREIEAEANRRSFALVEELNALRQKKIKEALPATLGGTGSAEWPVVVAP
jgi:hypothetical protein